MMKREAVVIRTNRELKERYQELKSGDCFAGMLTLQNMGCNVFVDLLERGVRILPSALSQILSRSKTGQAFALKPWMVPHTLVIARRADLLFAVTAYTKQGIGTVVTKEDHLHCGYGIHRWDSIETVYNHASRESDWYPFVIQPFLEDYTDVRVIVAGDYCEAYARKNKNNFRQNLAAGGVSTPYSLSDAQISLCRAVMERGGFPYAHLDLLVASDDRTYVSEIALNGGLKGARTGRSELDAMKKEILEKKIAATY